MRGCHRKDEVRKVGCMKDHGVEMCYCDSGRDKDRTRSLVCYIS